MEYCIVCFDPLESAKDDHRIVCAECNIDIHDLCFNEWLSKNNTICPHCRCELFVTDLVSEPVAIVTYPPALTAAYPPTLTATYPPALTATYPPALTATYPPALTATYPPALTATYPPALTAAYPPALYPPTFMENRISPMSEQVVDFTSPAAPTTAPAAPTATVTPTVAPTAIVMPISSSLSSWLVVFFMSLVTLMQEYLVWNLNLDFGFFIVFPACNLIVSLFAAKLGSIEHYIQYPLFSSVLVFMAMISLQNGDFFTYLLAWIGNVCLWSFIFLLVVLYTKIRLRFF